MRKRLYLFIIVCSVSIWSHAQWTNSDSIALKRMLNSDGEIKINPDAVKQIDFGFIGEPLVPGERPALNYDETLPKSDYLQKEKYNFRFSLSIYKPTTKFNYDPVLDRKIKVGSNTWQIKPYNYLFKNTIPTNWARNWKDNRLRNSQEEIRAAGVRQVIIATGRNRHVPSYEILPMNGNAVNLGGGKTMHTTNTGSTIGGLDLMAPFTKEFWDRRPAKRRARTLQVISNY